jgi:hypothetical protein
MEDLKSILARVDAMSIPELEVCIRHRSDAAAVLHLENRELTKHLDLKWFKQITFAGTSSDLHQRFTADGKGIHKNG